jgi:hypothetical protein
LRACQPDFFAAFLGATSEINKNMPYKSSAKPQTAHAKPKVPSKTLENPCKSAGFRKNFS